MFVSEGFKKFCDSVKQNSGKDISTQSIYVLQTVDMDGNITDEKYGVNLRTDVGMICENGYYQSLYLGTGTTQPTYYDTYMPNAVSEFTKVMDGVTQNWVLSYDSTTGMLSVTSPVSKVTYDYNIDGITTDQVFTELGICEYSHSSWSGDSLNVFSTHTLIYDQLGNVSSITKHPNEKLIVVIYKTMSMSEDVIDDAYTNGVFVLIDMARSTTIYGNNGTSVCSAGLNPILLDSRESYSDYRRSTSNGVVRNSEFDPGPNTNNYSTYVVGGSLSFVDESVENYYDHIRFGNNNTFQITKRIRMSSPETLTTELAYTDSIDTNEITRCFGESKNYTTMHGILPCIDFNMTDSKMYNNKSGAWDISDPFTNAPNADYIQTTRESGRDLYTSMISFNTIDPQTSADVIFYVAVNVRDDIPVTSIEVSDGSVFYVARKYWDTSTWVRINDVSNIPAANQLFRYFISKTTNIRNIRFVRDQTVHSFDNGFTPYALSDVPSSSVYTPIFVPVTSETYHWIVLEDKVIAMNNNGTIAYSHQLYGDSNNSAIDTLTARWGFDNKFVAANTNAQISPTNIRIFNMTTMTSSSAPSYTDIPLTNPHTSYRAHYSKASAGYVALWYSQNHTADIVDVTDETLTTITECDWFHIQDFTTYAIYLVQNSSPLRFNVYDLTANEVTDTFVLPADYTSITSVCGCGDHFYIQIGSDANQTIIYYNLSTKQVSVLGGEVLYLTNTMGVATNSWPMNDVVEKRRICYCRDGIVVCGSDGITRCISFVDPTSIFELFVNSTAASRKSIGLSTQIVSNSPSSTVEQLLLINYQLFLDWSRDQMEETILDIGNVFNTRESTYNPYLHFKVMSKTNGSNISFGGMTVYGGKVYYFNDGDGMVYPLTNVLPHKITGSTYTYQQYNNPKSYNFNNIRVNLYRSNHGSIVSKPNNPATFNVSGAKDGSGTGVRWKSNWRWIQPGTNQTIQLNTGIGLHDDKSPAEAIGLSDMFKVSPGDTITVNATLKSGITSVTQIDNLFVQIFFVVDDGSDPINNEVAYQAYATGSVGQGITVPTGTYSTTYLRAYVNIIARDSSNIQTQISATFLDTYSISVT